LGKYSRISKSTQKAPPTRKQTPRAFGVIVLLSHLAQDPERTSPTRRVRLVLHKQPPILIAHILRFQQRWYKRCPPREGAPHW
jgi:hypothetical protein